MAKRKGVWTVLAVKKVSKPGFYFVGGVSNLGLRVHPGGARTWVIRIMRNGRRTDIRLGSLAEITMGEARRITAERIAAIKGPSSYRPFSPTQTNPLQLPAIVTEPQIAKPVFELQITFKHAAERYIGSHRSAWKNVKHADQWNATLATYAYPTIGDRNVSEITLDHIVAILEPIWRTKTETASRVRGRIELILEWARVFGFRSGSNPAQWKGNLEMLLPAKSKVSKVRHHLALPWEACPKFYAGLDEYSSTSEAALKFCILTATRTGEVRFAEWPEIDLEKAVWSIPAVRMKAGKEHRVPLSKPAIDLLRAAPRFAGQQIVFANNRGGALCDMALLEILRGRKVSSTVHGFRSSFRDWAGEDTDFAREVIEHALAHQLKDKAEAAYARGNLFRKRAALMESWAEFLDTGVTRNRFQLDRREERGYRADEL